MTTVTPYDIVLIIWFVLAVVTFIALFFITAPYGRHARSGWGPRISARWGWIIMESPAPIVFSLCFFAGVESWTAAMLLLFGMWQFHYVYRTFIYPFLHRSDTRKMPLLVVGIAFVFGLVNTYLLGSHLFTRADYYGDDWLRDPRFLVGTSMFVVGLLINRQSDRVLHDLRDSEEMGYQVPEGGLYRWVSSPNYLGEIVQWFGWAIATWSLAGLAFAVWTVANLAPRARSHHQWYRQKFRDYPAERRALLPMIW